MILLSQVDINETSLGRKIKMNIRTILCWLFGALAASMFIVGFATHFIPIHGSKDMSRFQVEWYQLTHYWYIWLSMMVGVVGFHFTAKK